MTACERIRDARQTVTVKIENGYEDGHESERTIDLRAPRPGEDLDDWWHDVVYPETGDGHGVNMNACYVVTVLDAPDPALIGETMEWMG